MLKLGLTFVAVAWCADLYCLQPEDVALHCAPLSHGAGFHLLVAVARGAQSALHDSFQPPAVREAVGRYGVTATWLVPTQIRMLLDEGGLDRADRSTLRRVIYGSRDRRSGGRRELMQFRTLRTGQRMPRLVSDADDAVGRRRPVN